MWPMERVEVGLEEKVGAKAEQLDGESDALD